MTIVPISGHRRSVLARSLALALVLPMSMSALAQDAAEDEDEDEQTSSEAATLDRVTVVGSRINRAATEGPAPVQVITRADIEREGFQTVADALQTLTQNTTSSFTGDLAVTGFTPNAQVVNLRNLGPGYTLTLINGRRPAQYPQPYNRDNNVVNVRAIPSSMIERIEILSGGASAIYGSDAVAGVVNIVLRTGFEGNLARVSLGTTAEGGGDSVAFEFTGGRTGDRWSTTWALEYGNTDPVFASQRDFLSDTRNGPLGRNFTNPALALATLRFRPTTGAIGTSVYYPGQAVCDRFGYTTVTTAARGTYCGSFDQPASRSISNKDENYSGYNYTTFDITDDLTLFGSVGFFKSDASSSSGTEFWSTSNNPFIRTQDDRQVNGYWDPQFNQFTFLQRVFNPFELGGPEAATTLYDEFTYDFMVGVQGTLADRFDWELSGAYSKYEYEADRPRLLAQGITDYFLGPVQGYRVAPNGLLYPIHTLNLDRWNAPITPAIYDQIATRAVNTAETSSQTYNFTISGDLFELPAGAVGFAGVLEAGSQVFDLNSDPRLNPLRPRDSQTVYNLVSSGRTYGERDRYAAGVEFRVPIFEMLTGNIAARYDKYDDITQVDDAVTVQAGLEFRPFDSLLLRSSYATSFRAPDMQQVFAEGAASFAGILDEYACRAGVGVADGLGPRARTACNVAGDPTIYTTQTTIAGNQLLEEEKGESFGAGFVWDIAEGMSFTADYYRIKLEDQTLQLSSAFLLQNEANCRLGVRPDGSPFPNDPSSAFCQNIFNLVSRQGGGTDTPITRINSAYINAALSDTSGIDATYRYTFGTENWGRFGIDLGYSIVLTDKFKQFETDPLVDDRDVAGLNSRSRARGSVTWTYGDWSTTVFGTRYGTAGSAAGVDGTNLAGNTYPRRLAPFMLYNATVSKRFGDDITATFSVVNVFNNQIRNDQSSTGYPFFSPFVGADPLGRRFNLAISYRF